MHELSPSEESRYMTRQKREMSAGLVVIDRRTLETGRGSRSGSENYPPDPSYNHSSFLIRLPSYLLIITLRRGKSVTAAWTPLTQKHKHGPGPWHKTWGKCRQARSPGHLNTHHVVSFLGFSVVHNTSSSLIDHEAMV